MFNSIRGVITAKHAESLYIETGGVEWDITSPSLDVGRFPPVGEEARIYLWLYLREDQMRLYGFAGEERRAMFLELLKVEGIGPKGAVKILGGIGQEELERALETEDVGRLEAVPGLGKKTAQKMILALRGKLTGLRGESAAAGPYAELAEALAGMGYDRRAAVEALKRAEADLAKDLTGEARERELFRLAIRGLSGLA
ncbi:MAG: Holliday junction branch migration protein RuvA [Spirochaetaceae bacterium]|nr:Holliday junction branch migration protein RuvA [Spirochaetaceae bacterium]